MGAIVFSKQKLPLWDQSVQETQQEAWKHRKRFFSLGPVLASLLLPCLSSLAFQGLSAKVKRSQKLRA